MNALHPKVAILAVMSLAFACVVYAQQGNTPSDIQRRMKEMQEEQKQEREAYFRRHDEEHRQAEIKRVEERRREEEREMRRKEIAEELRRKRERENLEFNEKLAQAMREVAERQAEDNRRRAEARQQQEDALREWNKQRQLPEPEPMPVPALPPANTPNVNPIQSPDAVGANELFGHVHPGDPMVTYWDGYGIQGPKRIVINLSRQLGVVTVAGEAVSRFALSSGAAATPTPTGRFQVLEKIETAEEGRFGSFGGPHELPSGSAVGRRDVKSPQMLPFCLVLDDSVNGKQTTIHGGFMPGYAATKGDIRLPGFIAEILFREVSIGTEVLIVP